MEIHTSSESAFVPKVTPLFMCCSVHSVPAMPSFFSWDPGAVTGFAHRLYGLPVLPVHSNIICAIATSKSKYTGSRTALLVLAGDAALLGSALFSFDSQRTTSSSPGAVYPGF